MVIRLLFIVRNSYRPVYLHAGILLVLASFHNSSGEYVGFDFHRSNIRVQDDKAIQAAHCTVCGYDSKDNNGGFFFDILPPSK